MSPPTTKHEPLADVLSDYARSIGQGRPDESLIDRVREMLPTITDPAEFRLVAAGLWDSYLCAGIDPLLLTEVLRRWLAIEPTSNDAKELLGRWLLLHGPDWDDEAHRLLAEAKS